ncbi:hypothetical protein [Virgisporangium aurantiacum]|uniref:Uncharacterized protein n=1 Tax=Virgisporangium aurantiacum TaxID=175570 RepID=A0A8J3Z6J4_9ACTN|nr:hypothetical protein [Virgisporangium aurantiacum]GIJ58414.1 hypothetical protein Vau01_059300 [Virgisporangium aurantiacum]
MSDGLADESALIYDADGVTLTTRGDRGTRRWNARFPPYQRSFPNPRRPSVAVPRRRSLRGPTAARGIQV